MTAIGKFEVPIDDQWHPLFCGEVLHVGAQFPGIVAFWTEISTSAQNQRNENFKVIGTGHEWPENSEYVGTVQDVGRGLVWHLMRRKDFV